MEVTDDYSKFQLLPENREVNLKSIKTQNLADSMIELGWLDSNPLTVKEINGGLYVLDGQHRLAIAREYGIPVKYVVVTQNIDVARLNSTSKPWTLTDYAKKYATLNFPDYVELLEFKRFHPVTMAQAVKLLGGVGSGGGVDQKFRAGHFRVTDRERAFEVVRCYESLIEYYPKLKKASVVNLLMKAWRLPDFSPERLLEGAAKLHIKKVRGASTTDMLEVLEEIYNYFRRDKYPLVHAINSLKPDKHY